jgi:peptidoglycan/LPS O-acetylase OafA/YrhL
VARPAGIAIGVAGLGLCALAAVHGMAGAVGGALVAAGAGAIVAGPFVRQWAGGGTGPVLGSRPLRWLGERSYSLYLLHFLVLAQLAPVAHGRLVVLVALGAPASIAAAALLYQLVERPFMTRPASAPAPLPTAAPAPRVGGA